MRLRIGLALGMAAIACMAAATARAQQRAKPGEGDTAGLGGRPGSWPVDLEPKATDDQAGGLRRPELQAALELGYWSYRAERNPDPRDGVPWILHATPIGPEAGRWRLSSEYVQRERIAAVPVVRLPEPLWKAWLTPDMADVVGIHYHEFVTNDLARVLITIHKAPADGTGQGAEDASPSRRGTRLEATLLAPLTYSLDQSFVIRAERGKAAEVDQRVSHEQGHGERSLEVLLQVLAGPQDWNAEKRTGRRSRLTWYWRAQRIGRPWDGYREGRYDLATMRTSIALVPPTRWSKLLPKPPEALTEADLREFNDEVVHLDARFFELDRRVQGEFHGEHGAFE